MSLFLPRTAIAAFCALAISTSAAAQAPVQSDSLAPEVTTVSRSAPTIMAMTPTPDAVSHQSRQEMAPVFRRREAFSRPAVLMIVGGALIVTGLLVGDDAANILYIAGAGIGGYGLYLYLQTPDARMRRR